MHPWIIARTPGAREVMEAGDIAALRRQKMPPEVVQALLADARAYDVIAKAYGVTYQMVAQIKTRRLYAHVPYEGEIPRGARGGGADAATVREIFLDPSPAREIALRHGVSLNVVRQIKQRVSHESVTRNLIAPPSGHETLRAEVRAMKERHKAELTALLQRGMV
jgi:hypothetical protein